MPFDWSSLISSLFGSVGDMVTSHFNRKNQREENALDREFNAEEAAKQREFQSKEAEDAFERQVEFYDTRQSPAAMMQQYEKAGVNPAIMYGGSSPSPTVPSQSAPQGSAASVHSSALPTMLGIGDRMISFAKAIEEMRLMRAEAANKESQTRLNKIDELFRAGVNESNIAKAWSIAGYNDELKNKVIQDVVNSKELTAAQVHELTQKALYHQAAADERSTASAVNVENVWNRRAETKERIANVGLIIQNIKTSSMDEKLKGQLILQSIAQTSLFNATKLEVGERIRLLGEQIGLTSKQAEKCGAEIDLLVQKYGHDKVMNAFDEIIKGIETGEKSYYRDDNLPGMIINVLQGCLRLDFGIN